MSSFGGLREGVSTHQLRREGGGEFSCPWHPLQGHGRTQTKKGGYVRERTLLESESHLGQGVSAPNTL